MSEMGAVKGRDGILITPLCIGSGEGMCRVRSDVQKWVHGATVSWESVIRKQE